MTFLYDERLENFEKEGLGLQRDNTVRLLDHNPRWQRVFSDEAHLILHKLNIETLRLYHCGSTAVRGIVAKPIIDIVGSISDLNELDEKKELLEEVGYVYKGEYGVKGRRYSILYNPKRTKSFCHLHIFKSGSKEFNEHLNFRDTLRIDREAATKYEDHKKSLRVPRVDFNNAKASMINEILNDAKPYFYPREKAKVLVVFGASKGHKNTMAYVERLFLNNDLEIIDLQNFNISPFVYGKKEHSDDFINIIKKMIDSDRIVFATPVYWYVMSATLKDFIDRLSDLLSTSKKELGESLYGKKVDLLSTGTNLEIPNGFSIPFNLTATYFGMDFMEVYYKSTQRV